MKRLPFEISKLVRIADASTFQHRAEPTLRIGDIVQLNSGGPRMMVVDLEDVTITAAWPDGHGGSVEETFALGCVHRISPL